jgi:hypothetical protein
MGIYKPVNKIVNKEELNLIISTREIISLKEITEDAFLLTYYPEISRDICVSHENDYIKVLTLFKDSERTQEFNDVSLTVSAAVTGYARIYM